MNYPSLFIVFGDKNICTVIASIFRGNIPGTSGEN